MKTFGAFYSPHLNRIVRFVRIAVREEHRVAIALFRHRRLVARDLRSTRLTSFRRWRTERLFDILEPRRGFSTIGKRSSSTTMRDMAS